METQGRIGNSEDKARALWFLCGLLFLFFLLVRVGRQASALLEAAGLPLLAGLASPFLSCLSPFLLYFYFLRGEARRFFALPTARGGREALPLFPFLLAAVVASAYASHALMGAFGLPVVGGGVRGEGFFSDLLTNALFPAFFEELFFRGAVLSILYRWQGKSAVWVSAILFAFAHGSLYQLPYAFVGGVFLALATVVSGSWVWAFVFHFGNNLFSLSLQYAEGLGEGAWILAVVLYALVALGAVAAAVYLLCDRSAGARGALFELFATPRQDGARVLRATLASPLVLYLCWMLYLMIMRGL